MKLYKIGYYRLQKIRYILYEVSVNVTYDYNYT